MGAADGRGRIAPAAVVRVFLLLALLAAFLIAFGSSVYAEAPAALTVKLNGNAVKDFSLDDLKQIAADEGNVSYSFSAWNTYPSFSKSTDVHGVTVSAVLEAAGVKDDISDTGVISFIASDGYQKELTGLQLLGETRYFYPDGNKVDQANGVIAEDAYEGRTEVPAVISTEASDNYKLYIGQAAPNEQNKPIFVNNLASGGTIDVSTSPAPKCKPVEAEPVSGTMWKAGKEISFSSENNYEYDKVYFEYGDNSVPGYGSAIFNCGPKQDLECCPVLTSEKATEGTVVIKVVVKGYGKQDSDVQKFTYEIGDALTVKVDGVTAKTYDADGLEAIEGALCESLDYSGYSSYPTLAFKKVSKGVKVDSIIKDATGKAPSELSSSSTIKFTGADGYSSAFTVDQLFGTARYYYPNAASGTDRTGGAARAAAYAGAVSVPAVIDLGGENQLMFGQAAPNEQNLPEYVSYMLSGGTIEINTEAAPKCGAVTGVSPASGSVVSEGAKISFPVPDKKSKRDKVYYIVDPAPGQVPGYGCAFYYYSPYNWPEALVNPPVITGTGQHTVAVRVMAYGKLDSEVTYLSYSIPAPAVKPSAPAVTAVTAPAAPQIKLTAGKRKITVKWNAVDGASGYVIYRSTKKTSGFKAVKTVEGGSTVSFVNKKLKKGKKYYYKVCSFKTAGETTVYSEFSAVKNKKAK